MSCETAKISHPNSTHPPTHPQPHHQPPSPQITAERIPLENDKVQTALDTLRKKRVRLVDTPAGYVAQVNDSAIVNMVAYQMLSDGTRGPEMKNIAAGEGVEVVLEEGRFLPGVMENVVGKKAGETVRACCWWCFFWLGGCGYEVYPIRCNSL